MSLGTDLVLAGDDLAEAETIQLANAISALGAEGEAAKLQEVVGEIDARVVYFRRQKLADAIARGVWLRTLAEAELGAIDLRNEWPLDLARPNRTSLVHWRGLAAAHMRGGLEAAVRTVLQSDFVTTKHIYRAVVMEGLLAVPVGALRDAFEQTDITVKELARRAGVGIGPAAALVGKRRSDTYETVRYMHAMRVAPILGVQPSTLPCARQRNRNYRRRRHRIWLSRQRKLTGGRWDKAYAAFRVALQEFDRVAGGGSEWDDEYAHWYAVELALRQAMDSSILNSVGRGSKARFRAHSGGRQP